MYSCRMHYVAYDVVCDIVRSQEIKTVLIRTTSSVDFDEARRIVSYDVVRRRSDLAICIPYFF
jgi:hypothetical protein